MLVSYCIKYSMFLKWHKQLLMQLSLQGKLLLFKVACSCLWVDAMQFLNSNLSQSLILQLYGNLRPVTHPLHGNNAFECRYSNTMCCNKVVATSNVTSY